MIQYYDSISQYFQFNLDRSLVLYCTWLKDIKFMEKIIETNGIYSFRVCLMIPVSIGYNLDLKRSFLERAYV